MSKRGDQHRNSTIRKIIMESIRDGKGAEFFRFHEATGSLAEILPELADCVGVDGGQYHDSRRWRCKSCSQIITRLQYDYLKKNNKGHC